MMQRMKYALIVAIAAIAFDGAAQTYPSKPIRLIVPSSPGGVNDTTARVMAPRLSAALGTTVIVENRPPNQVGTALVAKSANDGYTILNTPDNFPLTQFLMKDVPYDATRDFSGISLLWRAPQIIAIPAGLGVTDLAEFVRFAKSKPGSMNYEAAGAKLLVRLVRQLERRFGPLPAEIMEQLARADEAQLVTWGDAVLPSRPILAHLSHLQSESTP